MKYIKRIFTEKEKEVVVGERSVDTLGSDSNENEKRMRKLNSPDQGKLKTTTVFHPQFGNCHVATIKIKSQNLSIL